jgi:hypothetical protein
MISADDRAASHPTRLPGSGLTDGVRPLGAASARRVAAPGSAVAAGVGGARSSQNTRYADPCRDSRLVRHQTVSRELGADRGQTALARPKNSAREGGGRPRFAADCARAP